MKKGIGVPKPDSRKKQQNKCSLEIFSQTSVHWAFTGERRCSWIKKPKDRRHGGADLEKEREREKKVLFKF